LGKLLNLVQVPQEACKLGRPVALIVIENLGESAEFGLERGIVQLECQHLYCHEGLLCTDIVQEFAVRTCLQDLPQDLAFAASDTAIRQL
jgi:hypothetical protein